MMVSLLNILLTLAILVSFTGLQIFLSKKPTWWYGLVLPTFCLLFSIMTIYSMVAFEVPGSGQMIAMDEYGNVVASETIPLQESTLSVGEKIEMVIPVFLYSNIPTAILLVIYFACRDKYKKRQEMEKMNIQDLE